MSQTFSSLFSNPKPVIGCIHLLPLPGAPLYDGDLAKIYHRAIDEATLYEREGVNGLIIENFQDKPFYPDNVPAETIAAMSVVAREVINKVSLPVGINVLRNDAIAAIAIATATGAHFIRVNAHMGSIVTDQGLIHGLAHKSVRLRSALKSKVAIFADVGVKHAAPLAKRGLLNEAKDLESRGLIDALIVSGEGTGEETAIDDILMVKEGSSLPILIGSGASPENVSRCAHLVDGYIVGSYFKEQGIVDNPIDSVRVRKFIKLNRN